MATDQDQSRNFELDGLLERWKIYFPHEITPTVFDVRNSMVLFYLIEK